MVSSDRPMRARIMRLYTHVGYSSKSQKESNESAQNRYPSTTFLFYLYTQNLTSILDRPVVWL